MKELKEDFQKWLRIQGNYLNRIKNIYKIPIAKIILNGKKLKAFLLGSEMRQECSLLLLLFNIVLEMIANAIRQGKEIKSL